MSTSAKTSRSRHRSSSRRLLLDTHVFLWAASDPERLTADVRGAIIDPKNDVFISAAVIWEVVIKHALGKLRLPASPVTYLPALVAQLGFHHLPITHEHALMIAALPTHHRDPFDRMIIAQARFEGMTLISIDRNIAKYGVQYLAALG